ncbi:hypothetical protein NKR23_g2155 [Pleurostoma richardsiae]|uniref:SWIM-type domain-containing protein n=1 Tax=Pleurostoma richardsiae TaxID=41990 RepID=A0AA38VYC5_9PEZI|nr:hypothetical protein NKR23_g2155 [Pleurostoma richardsiae]
MESDGGNTRASYKKRVVEYPPGIPRLTKYGRGTFGINTGPRPDDTDWSNIKFDVLKEECRIRGLDATGSSKVLIGKLTKFRDSGGPLMAVSAIDPGARDVVGKGKSESGEKRKRDWRSYRDDKFNRLLEKVTSERMYIVDQHFHCDDAGPTMTFYFTGSSEDLYHVTIGSLPKCDCPAQRFQGPICKHIIYVLHRVLKTPEPYIYQWAFLREELEEWFTKLAGQHQTQNGPSPPSEHTALEGSTCPGPLKCVLCSAEWKQEGDWGEAGLDLDPDPNVKPKKLRGKKNKADDDDNEE